MCFLQAIYLLHFEHDDESARVDWIREFSLPFNVLSFNLATASRLRMSEIRTKGYSEYGKWLGVRVKMIISYIVLCFLNLSFGAVSGNHEDYNPETEMVYLETNMVNPKSLQQGIIAVDPPQMFCRSNGHHISFKPHVTYKEVVKDVEVDEPTLADDEEDEEDVVLSSSLLSNKSGTQLSNPIQAILEPAETTSTHLTHGNAIRKKASLSPVLVDGGLGTPSVAQMSEQLSSLIGISPGGGVSSVRPPSSGHGTTSSHLTKTPSPSRQRRTGLEEFMIPREINVSTNGNISKASSSSSPSREVEEILSPKNTEMSKWKIKVNPACLCAISFVELTKLFY